MRVSSREFIHNVEAMSEQARAEPLAITENGEDQLVLLSAAEYERLKHRDRRVVLTKDLTDEELQQIADSKMSAEHDHLNKELESWQP